MLALAATVLLAGCGQGGGTPQPTRAVVLVSGLASISPFTTSRDACADGLAAGSIDLAGAQLARFIGWLHTEQRIDEVDLVGHSMGGLYARAAVRSLRDSGSPVAVRSLTTIGTPWQGSHLADFAENTLPIDTCQGDRFCESQMTGYAKDIAAVYVSGSARELGQSYLTGPAGWNSRQAGVLDRVPVTLIGADRFTRPGADPAVWPNDGVVELRSALAGDVDDTHSDYVSQSLGEPTRQGC
ncbi:esterase/lipase family protein [Mycolicibacterium sp. CBM1]